MVKVEWSIKDLARTGYTMSVEDEEHYGLDEYGELFNRIEMDLFHILDNPMDATELDYTEGFNVLKTFHSRYYDDELERLVGDKSYNIIDVGIEDKYLVVLFKLYPDNRDLNPEELSYTSLEHKYMMLNKGNYADYLLSINGITALI